jgi:hypothetical protein
MPVFWLHLKLDSEMIISFETTFCCGQSQLDDRIRKTENVAHACLLAPTSVDFCHNCNLVGSVAVPVVTMSQCDCKMKPPQNVHGNQDHV